jgi:acetyl-CoA C-acetyltransferase
MEDVVILSGARTPLGNFGGAFRDVSAVRLGGIAIAEAVRRAGIAPEQVDEVIMANSIAAGLGLNPARAALLDGGLPDAIPAYTMNKASGSGCKVVALGAQAIKAGDAEIVVVGGMENMSAAPYLVGRARWGYRMGDGPLVDSMIWDGLSCPTTKVRLGLYAESIADEMGITREDQDRFGLASHQRAAAAIRAGRFQQEIVPVSVPGRKGETLCAVDEHPRADTSLAQLAKLPPAFKEGGTVTAGNASGIVDGAAALVLAGARRAQALGLKPLARIVSYASAGVHPTRMGLGPVPACEKALAKAGLRLDEIDLIEFNEAYAAQALGALRLMQADLGRVNVNGGAIALGHPIGACGARTQVTLVYALRERRARYGLNTLGIGGGQGVALIVERL